MTMSMPPDAGLPGLPVIADAAVFVPALARAIADSGLASARLSSVKIIRIRYRPGQRAILSVDLGFEGSDMKPKPASIWLHAGGKGKKATVDGGLPAGAAPILEPLSGARIYLFPADPHVAELARFVADPQSHAGWLLPGNAGELYPPELVRFRPGLGATFRWQGQGRDAVYVKIQKGADAEQTVNALQTLRAAAAGHHFAVPEATGFDPGINAYTMREVRGEIYRDTLAQAAPAEVAARTRHLLSALEEFHACGVKPEQRLSSGHMIEQSKTAAAQLAWLCPRWHSDAEKLAAEIAAIPVQLAASPAHGDMKPEHIVFARGKTVLLDLDSFVEADPLYDLAMLDVRIAILASAGTCSRTAAGVACGLIGEAAVTRYGRDAALRFEWLKACAALQVAKHHAQNPRPGSPRLVAAALKIGAQGLAACREKCLSVPVNRPDHEPSLRNITTCRL